MSEAEARAAYEKNRTHANYVAWRKAQKESRVNDREHVLEGKLESFDSKSVHMRSSNGDDWTFPNPNNRGFDEQLQEKNIGRNAVVYFKDASKSRPSYMVFTS